VRIGAVLATWSRFENYALNQSDMDRLREGLRTGKIDEAYVAMAKLNGTGRMEYCRHEEAESLHQRVLRSKPTLNGRFGPFWALLPFELEAEETPF